MRNAVVITGFGEALAAPESVWSLIDAGFKVAVFTRRGRSVALRHSRYVSVHEITAPEADIAAATADLVNFLDLSRAANPEAQHILLPLDDTSLWLTSQLPPSSHWILAGVSGEAAALALNKGKQIEFARAAGFKVPESSIASTARDVAGGPGRHFPIILRPARAVSLKDGQVRKGGNFICSGPHELERAIAVWREQCELLIQPYYQGTGEGVFGFATDQGVVGWSGHRRLRMMNPHGSGSSACESRPVSETEKEKIGTFIAATGWRGLFMFEFLRDQHDTLWFVEFNGRTWGSMALSRRQGLEYPAWAVGQAMDSSFVPESIPDGESGMVCRNLGREFMHLLFVLRGPKSKAIKSWPARGATLWNLFRIKSGECLYNWRRADWKVFFADAWGTVRGQLFKRR